ncbi:MAG: DUF4411 family protein [Deferribacteres bacterium]|nr:DUF4411 family protein [Deferribacteres bacterium]
MAYLLDANVFIQAKRLHYGMDFCPAFWEWLQRQNEAGNVFSIEKVADELEAGNDELSEWAVRMGTDFFLPPDERMLASLATVSQWVQGQNYRSAAVSAFLQDADYYLVAYALAYQHVVVTHEVASDGVRQVKIPNVCIGVQVKCMTPFEMLRKERARFVLDRRKRST